MKVAAIQHDIAWEDPAANFEHLAAMIAAAARSGAHLAVLAEMFATGFSMSTDRIAEPADGPSTRFLLEQAAAHGIWVCGSLPELPLGSDRPCNRLILAAPDGTSYSYDKIHLFSFADEHLHYAAGKTRVTVDVEGVRVAPFVCYDLRFPEEFWAAGADTDLYVVVANWPQSRRSHWTTLLSARAIENQAYVVGVNRVGSGGGLDYAGDSRIVDPEGEILAAGGGSEEVLVADVDPATVAEVRRAFPFLADRRG